MKATFLLAPIVGAGVFLGAYQYYYSRQPQGDRAARWGDYQEQKVRVEYMITDLGTLGGWESYAEAINEKGEIVGEGSTDSGTHAFLLTPIGEGRGK